MRLSVDGFVASPTFGGFISYIDAITCALAGREDVDVHYAAPTGQPFPDTSAFPREVTVHERPVTPRDGVRDGEVWTDEVLPFLLDEIDPDVHLGPAFMLPPEHRRPQVVTLHDTMFERFPQFYGDTTRHYLQDQTLRALENADVAIAVSAATRTDALADWEPTVPVRVTPLAPHLIPASGSVRPLPEPYLLNVGGAHRRKRLDVLIESFAILAERKSAPEGLRLVVVGVAEDPYVQGLVAASPVRERIVLTPRVSDAELAAWYAHAEGFVYPSEYEGFGLTPLEAMASGAPVLTYENSALAENLGDAAVYAGPGAEALAGGVSRLLADADRREQLRRAGRACASGFTWGRTAEATVAALHEAIETFHAPRSSRERRSA